MTKSEMYKRLVSITKEVTRKEFFEWLEAREELREERGYKDGYQNRGDECEAHQYRMSNY
jgi:hypothetical protein